jgi:hypothetical protein
MADHTDLLIDSLLWEGYALYPYTPMATKNATPTPFGIVYPPVYAAECAGAFDHARLECVAEPAASGARLQAELRWLAPSGDRHTAEARTATLGPLRPGERDWIEIDGGRFTLRSEPLGDRLLVRACVHNTREVSTGLGRGDALAASLVSTQLAVRIDGGRFISPLDTDRRSANTYPVLTGERDEVMLGTTIVLPDHPQIAPESRGGLFDSTEIEEALLLHVHALSEGERAEIAAADPSVREMIERAETATPEQILALHGRVTMRDPREGEEQSTVGDRKFRRGDTVLLHPSPQADLQARMVDGRRARLERILVDDSGRTHFGVTIDGDPGQELMRETGRFLYFFADEVELVP